MPKGPAFLTHGLPGRTHCCFTSSARWPSWAVPAKVTRAACREASGQWWSDRQYIFGNTRYGVVPEVEGNNCHGSGALMLSSVSHLLKSEWHGTTKTTLRTGAGAWQCGRAKRKRAKTSTLGRTQSRIPRKVPLCFGVCFHFLTFSLRIIREIKG